MHQRFFQSGIYKIITAQKGLSLPEGIGSNNASHALIFSKKPLRDFSVCSKKLSSLKEKENSSPE